MAIQTYNLDRIYSLQIKPDFIAEFYADVENNEASLAGKYVMIEELDDQIYYVQDNLNGSYSILPAYDLDSYSTVRLDNSVVYEEIDVVPGATESAIVLVPQHHAILDSVQVAGDGDGDVKVLIDNEVKARMWINWQNANVERQFNASVEAGTPISINIKCNALATSTYGVTITYR